MIKATLVERWPGINIFENVLIVLPVPEGYGEQQLAIMKECVYNAGLIKGKNSRKLQLVTECESIHYLFKICKICEYLIF